MITIGTNIYTSKHKLIWVDVQATERRVKEERMDGYSPFERYGKRKVDHDKITILMMKDINTTADKQGPTQMRRLIDGPPDITIT